MTPSPNGKYAPRRFFDWLRSVVFYDHWMIGVINQPIGNCLGWTSPPPVHWIAAREAARYLADPFAWPGRDKVILCEVYDIQRGIGHIASLNLDAGVISREEKIDFLTSRHMSFPFLFAHKDIVYALPETCADHRLDIFRWDGRQTQWIKHTTVQDNLQAADAALFEKDGLFWISYTDLSYGAFDNLHLISAPALTGPWRPHPQNPVRTGRSSSRNGGAVFAADGKLYRPAQDCSAHYGAALRIMEITEWTTTAYREREAARIAPLDKDYPDGIHTLNAWGDKCLVDGMRLSFAPSLVWNKMRRRLRRFFHIFL